MAEEDGVERSLRVHGRFVHAFEWLAEQPRAGRRRPELTGERFRWWNVHNWIVIYDPHPAPITVLRVIHGARALDQILRPYDGG